MNLAETQVASKKLILLAVAVTILYYLAVSGYKVGLNLWHVISPPAPIPAEAKFGPLPKMKMTSIPVQDKAEFVIDTQDGKLPAFSDRIKVYPIVQPKPNLLAEQKMKNLASTLGFSSNFIKTTASDFQWIDGITSRKMNANVATTAFDVTTDINKLGSVLSNLSTITPEDATGMVSQFLLSNSFVNSEEQAHLTFTTMSSEINLGKLRDIKVATVPPKIMKVDVLKNIVETGTDDKGKPFTIATYKILNQNLSKPKISFLVTNDPSTYQFPSINFSTWDVELSKGSEYFISPIANVWETVKAGNGIVAQVKVDGQNYYEDAKNVPLGKVFIRNVYLAYYEPNELAGYLQPVYVFEGVFENANTKSKGEVTILYPAVRGDFVN